MNISMPTGIGSIIAIIVLVLCVVLMVVGGGDRTLLGLIAALAVARLC